VQPTGFCLISSSMQLSQAVHHLMSFSLSSANFLGSCPSAMDCLPLATMSATRSRMFLFAQNQRVFSSFFLAYSSFFPLLRTE
jgi:hypothetical protein